MPMSPHRPALAAILVATVALLALPGSPAAAAGSSTPISNPIALTALKYEGSYQGECWPFVQKVVREATGRQLGFDYREGFFETGAVEVSVDAAESGDIIQVARDSDTSPGANYPGLHTAIVLANLGNGRFEVVDSNSQFDGIVRRRFDYSPSEAAARYPGLSFHVYRVPSGGPPDASPKPSPATDFLPGDRAKVNTPADCLNLRTEPSLAARVIACLPDKTEVAIAAAPVTAGGRRWVRVATAFGEGWVAAEYLAPASAGSAGAGGQRPILPFRNYVPQVAFN